MTAKQQKVYDFIKDYFVKEQRTPNIIEIKNHFGFKSKRTVCQYLESLEEHHCIKRVVGQRNIRLIGCKITFEK